MNDSELSRNVVVCEKDDSTTEATVITDHVLAFGQLR